MDDIDGYERNALETAYGLLRDAPLPTADLLEGLQVKRYTRDSLTAERLAELLRRLPGWFVQRDGRWTALDRATAARNVVGIRIRRAAVGQSPPFVYVSGGGSVYHSSPDCTMLWEGKEKARSEGLTLREIHELSLPEALGRVSRGCVGCVDRTPAESSAPDAPAFQLRSPSSPPEPLDQQDWEAAAAAARDPFPAYAAYGPRSPQKQYSGRLGELAASRWLQRELAGRVLERVQRRGDLFVRPIPQGRGEEARCDVQVGVVGVEVKTYRVDSRRRYGIGIAGYQLERIQGHSRVVFYWTLPDRRQNDGLDQPPVAWPLGWISVGALVSEGRAYLDASGRRQIRIPESALAAPETLLDALVDGKLPTWRRPPDGPCQTCGAPTQAGICWGCVAAADGWPVDAVLSGRVWHLGSLRDIGSRHPGRNVSGVRRPLGEVLMQALPCAECARWWQQGEFSSPGPSGAPE